MLKYTTHTLHKIETLIKELGYVLRYEKGTFKSGYCILADKKVIVVNKYFEKEARITSLLDLIPQLELQTENLSKASTDLLAEINQTKLEL